MGFFKKLSKITDVIGLIRKLLNKGHEAGFWPEQKDQGKF